MIDLDELPETIEDSLEEQNLDQENILVVMLPVCNHVYIVHELSEGRNLGDLPKEVKEDIQDGTPEISSIKSLPGLYSELLPEAIETVIEPLRNVPNAPV